MKYTRNQFLKLAGMTLGGTVALPSCASSVAQNIANDTSLNYGLSSYTFRNFSLDDTIKMTLRLGIKNLSLKSMHMPLESSPAEIKTIAEKVRAAGLNFYGAGVIYMKTKEEVDNTFAYAANAGLNMIIGVPNHELLPLVEEKVKSTNIVLAIHNHGPGDKLYTSPNDVYDKIKGLDKRIGLCIDIGHVQRIGEDPVALLKKYHERLYDMHMKDVTSSTADGGPVEIGRGVIDIPGVIRTLKQINYKGNMNFEFEKDGDDPLPGMSESLGYIRGIAKMT
ncbi:MAG: sugar phosphate isomerase/epimerase [Ginsengibacter sp.]